MAFHGIAYAPRTISAPGAFDALGKEAAGLAGQGVPVLLVADSGLRSFGLVARAEAALRDAGLTPVTYSEIAGEPKEAQVEAARKMGRASGVKAAVCLGGGSALDAGKLAAALVYSDEPIASFRLAAAPLPAKSIKIVCVPTTAGTGSEMTGVSVISDASKVKLWFWGAELTADLAILDPELTFGLPASFTAMTGMDALVHAIEAATSRRAAPESGAAAYPAITIVARHLRTAVREPQNIEARTAMLDASALGGLAIHKAGTALAHNIGHALGSLTPLPHGHAVALAMAATAAWVVEGDRPAFARVAEAMGQGADADAFPPAFRKLAQDCGLDLDASRLAPGLTPEHLAATMAAPENAAMRNSTKREVTDQDLLRLAEMTLAFGRA